MADPFRNSDALAACDAARVLESTPVAAEVAAAVEALLDDAVLRAGAARLRQEILAQPRSQETVAQLGACR